MPAKTPMRKKSGGSAARLRRYAPSPSPSPSRWSPPRFGRSAVRSPKKTKKRTKSVVAKKTKPAKKAKGRGKRSRSAAAAKRSPAYDGPASFRCPCSGMF